MVLLQISFDISSECYGIYNSLDAAMLECMFPREQAEKLDKLPGLCWKLWTIQPNECKAAGFYLFKTLADAESHACYAKKNYPKAPRLTNFKTEFYDIMESLSLITRAPITSPANPCIVK